MAKCLVGGCERERAYDACCEYHLWETEHFYDYLGGPHKAWEEGCPFCQGAEASDG